MSSLARGILGGGIQSHDFQLPFNLRLPTFYLWAKASSEPCIHTPSGLPAIASESASHLCPFSLISQMHTTHQPCGICLQNEFDVVPCPVIAISPYLSQAPISFWWPAVAFYLDLLFLLHFCNLIHSNQRELKSLLRTLRLWKTHLPLLSNMYFPPYSLQSFLSSSLHLPYRHPRTSLEHAKHTPAWGHWFPSALSILLPDHCMIFSFSSIIFSNSSSSWGLHLYKIEALLSVPPLFPFFFLSLSIYLSVCVLYSCEGIWSMMMVFEFCVKSNI